MGLVLHLDHNKMFVQTKTASAGGQTDSRSAAERNNFSTSVCGSMVEKSVEEFALGGRMVQCGDGQVRTIVQVLALWITDRAEHELILKWNPHDCFHCDCTSADRDCLAHFTSEHTNLYDSCEIEQKVQEAMTEGTYGEQGGPMAGRLHCSTSHAVTHPTVF